MRMEERIVNEVAAALERETSVNLHRFPLYLVFADGALTMDGEVEQIMAKKRALEVAASIPGVTVTAVKSAATAEEVVQETWIGVLRGLDGFEGRSSLKSWIFGILVNCAKARAVLSGRFAASEEDVRAVRGGECVVHPDVAELRKLGDEGRVVLFLARMKAGVLQAHDVAGLHRGYNALGRLAYAVLGESDRPFDDPCDFGGDRFQRMLGVTSLWTSEMREQDDLAAFIGELGDRRGRALDARCIRHHSVLDRHVQVDAKQNPFAFHIDAVERSKSGHRPPRSDRQSNLPIATAVSAMRLEKPHSLSYQAITRTSVPLMTLVWSM